MEKLQTRFGAVVGRVAAVGAVVLVPALAFAQGPAPTFDPAPTLAIVADAVDFITTVGLAVLGLIMIAKGIRWVRKAG